MGTPGELDEQEAFWSDRDAWRGDQHSETVNLEAWRESGEVGWVWAEPDAEPAEEWPEDMAGPEYWLFKKDGH